MYDTYTNVVNSVKAAEGALYYNNNNQYQRLVIQTAYSHSSTASALAQLTAARSARALRVRESVGPH